MAVIFHGGNQWVAHKLPRRVSELINFPYWFLFDADLRGRFMRFRHLSQNGNGFIVNNYKRF